MSLQQPLSLSAPKYRLRTLSSIYSSPTRAGADAGIQWSFQRMPPWADLESIRILQEWELYKYMKLGSVIALTLCALIGCAALRPVPVESIAKLPVVRVGDTSPQNTEYVVFYPAGFAFPVKLKAVGSLFELGKEVQFRVALAKDLYLYKYWASHDGKTWRNSHELLGVEFGGGFDVAGLQAVIKLEAK